MERSSPVCPVVGLRFVSTSCGAACAHNCMFNHLGGMHFIGGRAKIKRLLGIGKRVATCHLTAASDSELKFIWSGNTWCFRDAVESQSFSLGASVSCFVFHMCWEVVRGRLRMLRFRKTKKCPGEHANVSCVFLRFCVSTDSTDRFRKDGISASKAMDEYGIKGRLVLCIFVSFFLFHVLA